jgi:anti-anti-sigma factor
MDASFDHITTQQHGDVLALEISSSTLNDFDLAHAMSDEIEQASANWQSKRVVLSLKNVEFLTSVGLILFARLITHAKQTGTRLVLCDASETIAKALKVSRLAKTEALPDDQRLLLKPDLNTALAAFA